VLTMLKGAMRELRMAIPDVSISMSGR